MFYLILFLIYLWTSCFVFEASLSFTLKALEGDTTNGTISFRSVLLCMDEPAS